MLKILKYINHISHCYALRTHSTCNQPNLNYGPVSDVIRSMTVLYSDTDYIATHVFSTVAIQSVSLYSLGNGPYSDIFLTTVAIQSVSLYSPGNGLYSDTFLATFYVKDHIATVRRE